MPGTRPGMTTKKHSNSQGTTMPELSPETWAQIRYEYEHTDRPIADICAERGISDTTLRNRRRRWGWTPRRAPIPREGPPALAAYEFAAALPDATPLPNPPPQGGRERADVLASRCENPPHPDFLAKGLGNRPLPASGAR